MNDDRWGDIAPQNGLVDGGDDDFNSSGAIRGDIIEEEEEDQDQEGEEDDEERDGRVLLRDLTLSRVYGESWAWRRRRLRALSPFGALPGWRAASCIVKAGDDLRRDEYYKLPDHTHPMPAQYKPMVLAKTTLMTMWFNRRRR